MFGHCVEMDTVVADQNGRRELSGASREDQIEGQPRLAGPGRPSDQHGAIAHQYGGGVHAGAISHGEGAGSRTTKRAPATVGLPSASAGP